MTVPEHASGLAIFAHGSGNNRFSLRDQEIAQSLQRAGIATLLFDMATGGEDAATTLPFDLAARARRFLAVARWAAEEALPRPGPLGYFGVGTGAAAALGAAAERPIWWPRW